MKNMTDTPGWIRLLFKRFSADHALHTAFLLGQMNERIASDVNVQPNGRADLRRESLALLDGDDPGAVAMSLVCLGIVGESKDLCRVDPLLSHESDLVRRAARSCRFEISQRGRIKPVDVEPEIRADVGPMLDQLAAYGYRLESSTYSPECFGNWVIQLKGPRAIRLFKDRSQFMVSGDRSTLDEVGLSRAFDDPEEFSKLVLAWAAG
jgi:hypothetical protein